MRKRYLLPATPVYVAEVEVVPPSHAVKAWPSMATSTSKLATPDPASVPLHARGISGVEPAAGAATVTSGGLASTVKEAAALERNVDP
jgi:hypothetical protein